MDNIVALVFLVVVALIAGTSSGAAFEQNKSAKGFLLLMTSLVVTSILAFGTHLYVKKQTLFYLAPVAEDVYVVLKKVPDEKGAFLVLLDTKNNNERVAHLAVYPPEGYSETVLSDGRTVLAVTRKQIVVGDPDNTDFVPPAKVFSTQKD